MEKLYITFSSSMSKPERLKCWWKGVVVHSDVIDKRELSSLFLTRPWLYMWVGSRLLACLSEKISSVSHILNNEFSGWKWLLHDWVCSTWIDRFFQSSRWISFTCFYMVTIVGNFFFFNFPHWPHTSPAHQLLQFTFQHLFHWFLLSFFCFQSQHSHKFFLWEECHFLYWVYGSDFFHIFLSYLNATCCLQWTYDSYLLMNYFLFWIKQ